MAEAALGTVDDGNHLRVHLRQGWAEIAGNVVSLPGFDPVRLAPGPLAVMRVLLKAQGAVISRDHLLRVLPQCGSLHGLEMWISRLRQSLPYPEIVQTVVKRGYRLALAA